MYYVNITSIYISFYHNSLEFRTNYIIKITDWPVNLIVSFSGNTLDIILFAKIIFNPIQ